MLRRCQFTVNEHTVDAVISYKQPYVHELAFSEEGLPDCFLHFHQRGHRYGLSHQLVSPLMKHVSIVLRIGLIINYNTILLLEGKKQENNSKP